MPEYQLFKIINDIDMQLSRLNLNSSSLERDAAFLLKKRNHYIKSYRNNLSERDWSIKKPIIKNILQKINWTEIWVKV